MEQENNPFGQQTANNFSKLCALRGISGVDVEWRDRENAYFINGQRMGQSIDFCYEWLNKQPEVKP